MKCILDKNTLSNLSNEYCYNKSIINKFYKKISVTQSLIMEMSDGYEEFFQKEWKFLVDCNADFIFADLATLIEYEKNKTNLTIITDITRYEAEFFSNYRIEFLKSRKQIEYNFEKRIKEISNYIVKNKTNKGKKISTPEFIELVYAQYGPWGPVSWSFIANDIFYSVLKYGGFIGTPPEEINVNDSHDFSYICFAAVYYQNQENKGIVLTEDTGMKNCIKFTEHKYVIIKSINDIKNTI